MAARAFRNQRGLGWALRSVRQSQGRTLDDVSGAVGSDAGNLSRIENGQQNAPEALLLALAAELGVTMSQLWALAEDGAEATVDILAKAAKMSPLQVRELNMFADYLLNKRSEN